MRHRQKRSGLNRFTSWRKSTLNSMVRNLLIYQSIKTTKTKAKAAQPLAEKLITLAKANTLAAKREAFKVLNDHSLVSKLFSDIAGRFLKRSSGYTRVVTLGARRGDSATMAVLELAEIKKKEPKKPKKEKEAKPKEESKAQEAPVIQPKEKPAAEKKPAKKFLGGLKKIFKKERDSL